MKWDGIGWDELEMCQEFHVVRSRKRYANVSFMPITPTCVFLFCFFVSFKEFFCFILQGVIDWLELLLMTWFGYVDGGGGVEWRAGGMVRYFVGYFLVSIVLIVQYRNIGYWRPQHGDGCVKKGRAAESGSFLGSICDLLFLHSIQLFFRTLDESSCSSRGCAVIIQHSSRVDVKFN